MRVHSAESETTNSGASRSAVRCPIVGLRDHIHRAVFKTDVRIQFLAMQTRWNAPMLQRQQHLGQTRDSAGRLQMTDVGFQRARTAERDLLRRLRERQM